MIEALKLVKFSRGLRSLVIELTYHYQMQSDELLSILQTIQPRGVLIIANKFTKEFLKSFENLRVEKKFLFSVNFSKSNFNIIKQWLPTEQNIFGDLNLNPNLYDTKLKFPYSILVNREQKKSSLSNPRTAQILSVQGSELVSYFNSNPLNTKMIDSIINMGNFELGTFHEKLSVKETKSRAGTIEYGEQDNKNRSLYLGFDVTYTFLNTISLCINNIRELSIQIGEQFGGLQPLSTSFSCLKKLKIAINIRLDPDQEVIINV